MIVIRAEEAVEIAACAVAQLGVVIFRRVWQYTMTVEMTNLPLPVCTGASVCHVKNSALDLYFNVEC
jgi:hypothetical protein